MLGSECIILPNRKNSSKIGSLFRDMEESKKQNKRKTKQKKIRDFKVILCGSKKMGTRQEPGTLLVFGL